MENNQNSLEWFIKNDNQLNIDFLEGKTTQLVYAMKKVRLQEQAKAMYKEEIDLAYQDGKEYVHMLNAIDSINNDIKK